MTAELNRWLVENIYLVVIVLVGGLVAVHFEIRRLDKRSDAIIALLKRRGIDIFETPGDWADE